MRASAVAAPAAAPMSASSSTTSVQKRRDAASSRIRAMRRRRYQAPSTPSAISATTFTPRITPYGERSASHVRSPITARTVPEIATTTNAASAMLEYRVSAMAVRSRPRMGRTRTMSTSPPSQTAAAMMWRMSAIIASWWFASSPECPWVPIGTRAASARIATNSVAVHDRTANVSTVSTAPAIVVISQVRPSSVSHEEAPELRPELGARVDGGVERVDEGQESGRGGRDGEDGCRDGCRIQREVELALACLQGEERGHEDAHHAGRRQVDEQPRGREPPAHERARDRRGRAAPRRRRRRAPTSSPRARPRRGSRARRPAARGNSPLTLSAQMRPVDTGRTCRRGMPRDAASPSLEVGRLGRPT